MFTGEVLQTDLDGKPTRGKAIQWLADLLHFPLLRACPTVTQETLTWEPGRFDGTRFYALNNLTPGVDAWASLVDAEAISQSSAEYLAPCFDNALVIGRRMTPWMLKFFSEKGIPYLDFVEHTARFLDDVPLAVRTNVQEMYRVLDACRYAEDMLHLQAGIHRASLVRLQSAEIHPGSGLFIAQGGVDPGFISEGRFTRAGDYRQEIADFLQRHPHTYVKLHPYFHDGAKLLAFLRALAGDSARVLPTWDNAYSLLVHPNISELCGISSCLLYEAAYFGKPAIYLSKTRMDFGENPDERGFHPWRYVPLYDEFFNPRFWSRLLAEVCEVSPAAPDLVLPRKTNRMRNSLNAYWGYGHLDFEVQLRSVGVHLPCAEPDPIPAVQRHQDGVRFYQEGRYEDAVSSLAQALITEETAERWNDWGAAQLAAGHPQEALDGFRLAVRQNPCDVQAAENLTRALAYRP